MADIFLSYQKRDLELTRRVAEALQAEGFSVWWDERLSYEEQWDRVIEREIAACEAVLVLWTPNSVQSEWVRIEANYAKTCSPPKLIQARFSGAEVPIAFSLTQYVDLDWDTPTKSAAWPRLLTWLKRAKEADVATAASSTSGSAREQGPASPPRPAPVPQKPAAKPSPAGPARLAGREAWMLIAPTAVTLLGLLSLWTVTLGLDLNVSRELYGLMQVVFAGSVAACLARGYRYALPRAFEAFAVLAVIYVGLVLLTPVANRLADAVGYLNDFTYSMLYNFWVGANALLGLAANGLALSYFARRSGVTKGDAKGVIPRVLAFNAGLGLFSAVLIPAVPSGSPTDTLTVVFGVLNTLLLMIGVIWLHRKANAAVTPP